MRLLLGGGTQHNLTRIISKCHLPDVTFDYATSDDEPQTWARKAGNADVTIIRTGWVSHKAWRAAKLRCANVIPVSVNGEEALLDAIHAAHRRGSDWIGMIGPEPLDLTTVVDSTIIHTF